MHQQNRGPLAETGVQSMQAMNHAIPNPQCHEADGVSLALTLGPHPTCLDEVPVGKLDDFIVTSNIH